MRRSELIQFTKCAVVLGSLLLAGCEPIVTSIGTWLPDAGTQLYFEAESGELSGGFDIGDDPSASAGRFLMPPAAVSSEDEPGAARARYEFEIAADASYLIWGRIQAPGALNNRFWLQLDAGTWHKWRISTGEIWYWDDVHEDTDYGTPIAFDLRAGRHELVIANCVEGVRLDRLYITSAGDVPPGNDTPCTPPHSIQRGGECLPSCGSVQGTTCGQIACEGRELLASYDCDLCCRVP